MKTMYVYILKCADDSLYTGVTNNLEMRFEQHVQGINKNCYTFSRRPLEIVYCELFNNPLAAIAFEKKIKGWRKDKKLALINNDWDRLKVLSVCKNNTNSKNANTPSHFDSAQCDNKL